MLLAQAARHDVDGLAVRQEAEVLAGHHPQAARLPALQGARRKVLPPAQALRVGRPGRPQSLAHARHRGRLLVALDPAPAQLREHGQGVAAAVGARV